MAQFLIFCFTLLPVIHSFTANTIPMEPSPQPTPGDIVYEIFVRSFCDSNGDGLGDLNGITTKLDYLQTLGVTAIWLTPINPSPSYHKYDVSNYMDIDPEYGTLEDMEHLLREAHKRGLKVLMDLVVNHTSNQHPWFIASSHSPESKYRNYYVWRDYASVKDEIEKKTTTFDSDNITQWHEMHGVTERYYGFFSEGMPDLNFDNPEVRREVYAIGKFWLEFGFDGFRLDAARHIYPDDQLDKTKQFWEEFRGEMESVKPDVILVGEVWTEPAVLATMFKGLPSLFNFGLAKIIETTVQNADPVLFAEPYKNILSAYINAHTSFVDATLLSNHDMNRIRTMLGGDEGKSKLAAAILLTLPGDPYIYYGEEIGMLGQKPDRQIREPFLWSAKSPWNTSWTKPEYSLPPAVTPLDEQIKDPNSFYTFYHKWIGLRKAHPELSKGDIEFVPQAYPHVLAYIRTLSSSKVLVIHNLDASETPVEVADDFDVLDGISSGTDAHQLLLAGYSSVLLQLK